MSDEQREGLLAVIETGDRAAIAEYAFTELRDLPWATLFAYATRLQAVKEGEHFLRKLLDGAEPPPWWTNYGKSR